MTRINTEAFQRVRRELAELKGKPPQPLTDAQATEMANSVVQTQVQIDDERRHRLGDNGPEVGP